MNTIKDFKNAPVGATANRGDGIRAMKMNDSERGWIIPRGEYLSDEELELRGFTLDPLEPAPTTAREALDLAWELAHEVEEGQVIPADTRFLEVTSVGPGECIAHVDFEIDPEHVTTIRTLEPLPEPDWLDAPAVLATCGCRGIELWHPRSEKDGMWVSVSGEYALWSSLRDVTPLYPKEGQDA